jgi:hypothetical protein
MPWVGFESTVPASERAKTVHALDRSATVADRIHKRTALFSGKSFCTHLIEGWVGLQHRLDAEKKRKYLPLLKI